MLGLHFAGRDFSPTGVSWGPSSAIFVETKLDTMGLAQIILILALRKFAESLGIWDWGFDEVVDRGEAVLGALD